MSRFPLVSISRGASVAVPTAITRSGSGVAPGLSSNLLLESPSRQYGWRFRQLFNQPETLSTFTSESAALTVRPQACLFVSAELSACSVSRAGFFSPWVMRVPADHRLDKHRGRSEVRDLPPLCST